MAEEKDTDVTQDSEQASSAGSSKKKLMMIAIPLVIVAIAIPAYLFLGGTDKPAEVEQAKTEQPTEPVIKKALYFPFSEDFLVNISSGDGGNHVMRIAVTIMTRDQQFLDTLKESEPVIRNDLLILFSEQSFDNLKTLEGKRKLRSDAMESVKKSLEGQSPNDNVEAVLFTNFVME